MLAALGAAGVIWALLAIPDSLPLQRRVPLHPVHIGRAYARQLSHRAFMAYTQSGGLALSALFVYISGSAFVFTQHFSLTPNQFSYLFAANSVALVVGGLLSNRLLRAGLSSPHVLVIGLVLHAGAGLFLFLMVSTGASNLGIYASLLALAIGMLGLVFGNVTALTMHHAGPQAGIASALTGMLQYLIAAIVGYLVSLSSQGLEQLPLAIGVCGTLSLLVCYLAAHATDQPELP